MKKKYNPLKIPEVSKHPLNWAENVMNYIIWGKGSKIKEQVEQLENRKVKEFNV